MAAVSIPDPDDIIHNRIIQPVVDTLGIAPRPLSRAMHGASIIAGIVAAILLVRFLAMNMGAEFTIGSALALVLPCVAFPFAYSLFVWSDQPTRTGPVSSAMRLLGLMGALASPIPFVMAVMRGTGPADLTIASFALSAGGLLAVLSAYVAGCTYRRPA